MEQTQDHQRKIESISPWSRIKTMVMSVICRKKPEHKPAEKLPEELQQPLFGRMMLEAFERDTEIFFGKKTNYSEIAQAPLEVKRALGRKLGHMKVVSEFIEKKIKDVQNLPHATYLSHKGKKVSDMTIWEITGYASHLRSTHINTAKMAAEDAALKAQMTLEGKAVPELDLAKVLMTPAMIDILKYGGWFHHLALFVKKDRSENLTEKPGEIRNLVVKKKAMEAAIIGKKPEPLEYDNAPYQSLHGFQLYQTYPDDIRESEEYDATRDEPVISAMQALATYTYFEQK